MTNDDTIYIYNAPYPDEYDEPHVIFTKYSFEYEFDSSSKTRQGLPGLCTVYGILVSLPAMPCRIPNYTVPIRQCQDIGSSTIFKWPQIKFTFPGDIPTSLDTMIAMFGTSFVSCSTTGDAEYEKKIGRRTPVVPNMRIKQGCDAVSNTACLKLNFDGVIEPIWLGKEEREETVGVYLERLPAVPF